MHLRHSEFWHDLMHGVFGPRQGGARIICDAQNASTGVGKTSAAVMLARAVSKAFDYELSEDDFVLSGQEYLRRWREHPDKEQPSCIVLDELVGAGSGDARRSMSNQNVNLGRSWQLMRKKRIVTIAVLPHWGDCDKRLRKASDYRLWCLEKPIGYFRPYKATVAFGNSDVRTVGYDERIRFPNPEEHNDELFEAITDKKDELLNSSKFNADELLEQEQKQDPEDAKRETKIKTAQSARDNGLSTREVASIVDMSQSWVDKYTDSPAETEATTSDDD
jgi:hypothetical protein